MLLNVLRNTIALLNPTFHKRGLVVVFLLISQSFLDFVSIAAFFPLMLLIVNQGFVNEHNFVSSLYVFLGFTSQGMFVAFIATLLLFFFIVKNFYIIWVTKAKARFAFNCAHDISLRAISYLQSLHYLKYSQLDYSKELNRITNHPITFANNIVLPLAIIFSESLVTLMLVSVIGVFNVKLLLIVVIILMPVLIVMNIRRNSIQQINDSLKKEYPRLLKYVSQAIEGFVEIKILGKEKHFKNRFAHLNNTLHNTFIKEKTIHANVSRLTEIGFIIIFVTIIGYSLFMNQDYKQTILAFGVYAAAGFRLAPSLNRILLSVQQIQIHSYLLSELKDITDSPVAADTHERDVIFNNQLELKGIHFSYPEQSILIRNASMTIHKGETVAITGNSGEGKTTLLMLILRILKESSGTFLVDEESIEGRENAWLRKFGYIPQVPYLIDGTLIENIAFGVDQDKIDVQKINQLIKEVDLKNLVDGWPKGIETTIGERGAKISGGQRQRIMIARTLYFDPEIIILDEATNQIHSDGELEMISLLSSFKHLNKTILVVTHKIPQVDVFDAIYRVESGEVKQISHIKK